VAASDATRKHYNCYKRYTFRNRFCVAVGAPCVYALLMIFRMEPESQAGDPIRNEANLNVRTAS